MRSRGLVHRHHPMPTPQGTSIFLNVLSHLPRTWAGVVLSDASQPPSDALGSHPRVHVLEGLEHRMALMYAADVFLLPELEGAGLRSGACVWRGEEGWPSTAFGLRPLAG